MSGGTKNDGGKPPLHLIPHGAMVEVARALDFGGKKYGPYNWRNGFEWSRLISAGMRHRGAFNDGENLDSESGLCHIAHSICCDLFLLEHFVKGLGTDDRHAGQSLFLPTSVTRLPYED
jgi:hypothetical protein